MFQYFTYSSIHVSVFEMQTFATQLYQCKAVVVEKSLSESSSFILKELLLGHPVLVPYDNDKNFEPCLRKGHRAHWAVLTGTVFIKLLFY